MCVRHYAITVTTEIHTWIHPFTSAAPGHPGLFTSRNLTGLWPLDWLPLAWAFSSYLDPS